MAPPGGRGHQAAAPACAEEIVRLSVTPDSAADAGASGTAGVQHVRVEIKSTKGSAPYASPHAVTQQAGGYLPPALPPSSAAAYYTSLPSAPPAISTAGPSLFSHHHTPDSSSFPYEYDPEYGAGAYSPFSAARALALRHGFMRKVLGLLFVSLAATTAVAVAFRLSRPAQEYVAANMWTVWTAMISTFVTVLLMGLSERARRHHPWNLLGLGVFVACEALLVGTATAALDTDLLLLAFGLTGAITLGLAGFALQTRYDFTTSGGILLSALLALLLGLLLSLWLPRRPVDIIICCLAALLFSAYIVYDLQLLLGGQHMFSISPDEYVFATLNLYLDIMNLFLYLLRLLQLTDGRY